MITNQNLWESNLQLHNSLMDRLNEMNEKINNILAIVVEETHYDGDDEDDDEEDY